MPKVVQMHVSRTRWKGGGVGLAFLGTDYCYQIPRCRLLAIDIFLLCPSFSCAIMAGRRGRPRKNPLEPGLWDAPDDQGQKTTDFIFTMDKQGRASTQPLQASKPPPAPLSKSVPVPEVAAPVSTPADEYVSLDFEDAWVDPPFRAGDHVPPREEEVDESETDDEPQKDTGKRKKRASVSLALNLVSMMANLCPGRPHGRMATMDRHLPEREFAPAWARV